MNVNTIAHPSPAARQVKSAPPAPPAPPDAASVASAGAGETARDPSLDKVGEAVDSINRSMSTLSRGLEFSVDTDSRRTVVKVVDQQTKELIRQIPTEEALEIAQALERAQGLLIKQTA